MGKHIATVVGEPSVLEVQQRDYVTGEDVEGFKRELLASIGSWPQPRLVLDFARVGFLSAAALGSLVTLEKQCRAANVKLVLCGLAPEIMEVLYMCRLHRIFCISGTREEAIKVPVTGTVQTTP